MRTRRLVLIAMLPVVASACAGAGGPAPTSTPTKAAEGGVLKVGLAADLAAGMDPAKEYYGPSWALLRAMVRTLVTFPPAPAPEGNRVVPDLATDLPQVSADGLTYTFTLRDGIRFAPPVSREIICADVKAAFDRMFTEAGTGGYNFYYSVIEGVDEYQKGNAETISGISCPDDKTIIFRLTEPTGDFPYRLAMPATAPIPAAERVTRGHVKDYGRFLVASGPYMYEGSEELDFTLPSDQQKPVTGYQPGRSLTLVRNPNWDPATDDVRPAYVDEIQVTIGGDPDDLINKVRAGLLDVLGDVTPSAAQLQPFLTDPALQHQYVIYGADYTIFAYMNTSLPPFDDVHVRKAVNWVVDKAAVQRLYGGGTRGEIATHIVPPSMGGLPASEFDPFATPNMRGDLEKAKGEMRQSRYDSNGDGVCDATACQDVYAVSLSTDPWPNVVASLEADLGKIGIELENQSVDPATAFGNLYSSPAKKVQFGSTYIWGKDFPSALTFIDPLFNGANIQPAGNINVSQVDDPTLNAKIEECKKLSLEAAATCWNEADQYLTENLAPVVPLLWGNGVAVFSSRTNFVVDQASTWPAYAAISLTR